MSLKVGGNGQLSDILTKNASRGGFGGFHPSRLTKAQQREENAKRCQKNEHPEMTYV